MSVPSPLVSAASVGTEPANEPGEGAAFDPETGEVLPRATSRVDDPSEPRYVRACRDGAWRLATWDKGIDEGYLRLSPARCRSWRHEGDCARWRASVDWRRMADAFAPFRATDCVLLVFTFARAESPDPPTEAELERWGSPDQAWPELGDMLARWLKRMNRLQCVEVGCFGDVTYTTKPRKWRGKVRPARVVTRKRCRGECTPHESNWCSVVEQHRPKPPKYQAWPHLNVLVAWPWLAAHIRAWRRKDIIVIRNGEDVATEDGRIPVGPLLEHAVASDFGYQSWAMVARNKAKLVSYFAKICGEAVGEISKLTQRPLAAPRSFRRLRSGRGFLAPRFKSTCTGALIGQTDDGRPQPVSRATTGVRTYCEEGPPTYRPQDPTRWLDVKNRRVYEPSWAGWAELPGANETVEAWARRPPVLEDIDENDEGPGADARFGPLRENELGCNETVSLRSPEPSRPASSDAPEQETESRRATCASPSR